MDLPAVAAAVDRARVAVAAADDPDGSRRRWACERWADRLEARVDELSSANVEDLDRARRMQLLDEQVAALALTGDDVGALLTLLRAAGAGQHRAPDGVAGLPGRVVGVVVEHRLDAGPPLVDGILAGQASVLWASGRVVRTVAVLVDAAREALAGAALPADLVVPLRTTATDDLAPIVAGEAGVDGLRLRTGPRLAAQVRAETAVPVLDAS